MGVPELAIGGDEAARFIRAAAKAEQFHVLILHKDDIYKRGVFDGHLLTSTPVQANVDFALMEEERLRRTSIVREATTPYLRLWNLSIQRALGWFLRWITMILNGLNWLLSRIGVSAERSSIFGAVLVSVIVLGLATLFVTAPQIEGLAELLSISDDVPNNISLGVGAALSAVLLVVYVLRNHRSQ